MAKEFIPYDGPVVTRKDAKDAGQKRYFTGISCKHGHLSQRLVSCAACIYCLHIKIADRVKNPNTVARMREYSKAWSLANKEKRVAAAAAQYLRNKDKIRERNRLYEAENKEKIKRRKASYYIKNKTRISERIAKWQLDNRLRMTLYYAERYKKKKSHILFVASAWRSLNRAKLRGYTAKRRAKQRNVEGFFTGADIALIGNAQKWRCGWCGIKCQMNFHVDHIKPISAGGSNWPTNLLITCPQCNLRKGKKDPIIFAQILGKLL